MSEYARTPSLKSIKKFQKEILAHYGKHGRDLPWRRTDDSYRILVSEIMLQQTQVSRVETKYDPFIRAFPDVKSLDSAPLSRVLALWQGLGYNRRALSLKRIARVLVGEHNGKVPADVDTLLRLPGIGRATASSIAAFAFDKPVVFVETNIRTVFIHFFFSDEKQVSDEDLLALVEKCLYKKSPRKWYWALMDYGTMLKKKGLDKNAQSSLYKKQGRFEGSKRQIRGKILKVLLARKVLKLKEINNHIKVNYRMLFKVLSELVEEKFLITENGKYRVRD
jgi:A/G-specific adenine glycosylase